MLLVSWSLAGASGLQLLQAVAYLHDHWVTHRDLKLSNLLYTNDGKLKLCDFGLVGPVHHPENCNA